MIYTNYSLKFTQGWHGSFHMLRCWRFDVVHYNYITRCLAYESLRTIQNLRNLNKCDEI